jgi:hypothetical protein
LQAWQLPSQRLLQHTPCAQKLLAQSVSREHSAPAGCLPHEPPAQTFWSEHSALVVHELPQRFPLQVKGVQARASGTAQAPPRQSPAAVQSLVALLQLWSRHTVPLGYIWHPAPPVQRPLVAHEAAPLSRQARLGSVTPAAVRGSGTSTPTATQRPSELGNAQYMHCPSQAASQQTPSAQKPDLHWLPCMHGCPSPRMPQLPLLQVAGGTQSASEAQLSLQALPWQMEGAQLMGDPTTQVPLPSQVEAGVSMPSAQEAGRHIVPETAFVHPPAPLHCPV